MTFTSLDPSLTPTASIGYQNINNILINGGMEFWQRGTTFTNPSSGSYLMDRWKWAKPSSRSTTFTQESTTIDSGTYSVKFVAGAGNTVEDYFYQIVENYADYKTKTITLSVRLKVDTASAVKIWISDNITTTYSSYHTGDNTWQTLTASVTVSSSATAVQGGVSIFAACTGYADSAMLVIGSTPVTFVPKNYQTELAQCQRYFQKIGGQQTTTWLFVGFCGSTTGMQGIYSFPVQMRVSPTMTNFNVTNLTIRVAANDYSVTSSGFNNASPQFVSCSSNTSSAVLTAGQGALLFSSNSNAYFNADAEI